MFPIWEQILWSSTERIVKSCQLKCPRTFLWRATTKLTDSHRLDCTPIQRTLSITHHTKKPGNRALHHHRANDVKLTCAHPQRWMCQSKLIFSAGSPAAVPLNLLNVTNILWSVHLEPISDPDTDHSDSEVDLSASDTASTTSWVDSSDGHISGLVTVFGLA